MHSANIDATGFIIWQIYWAFKLTDSLTTFSHFLQEKFQTLILHFKPQPLSPTLLLSANIVSNVTNKTTILQKLFHLPASQPKLFYKNYLGKFLFFLFSFEEFSLLLSKYNTCIYSVDFTHCEFLKNLFHQLSFLFLALSTSPSECALSPQKYIPSHPKLRWWFCVHL